MCILRLIKVLSKHFWLTKKIFSFSKKKKKKFHIRFSKPQCKCVCPFLPYVILKTETMSSIWSHKMPYLFYQLAVLFKKKKKSFYWPIKLMGHCKVFNYLSQLVLLIMRHDLGVWGGGFFSVFPIATVISFWNPKLVIQLLYIVWKTKLTCVMLVLMIN